MTTREYVKVTCTDCAADLTDLAKQVSEFSLEAIDDELTHIRWRLNSVHTALEASRFNEE